jgi:hypothetical protein
MITKTSTLGTYCLAGVALLASSSIAMAGGDAPILDVGWAVDGISSDGMLTGEGLGAGVYRYTASSTGVNYEINWSFTVTDNGASGGFEILASSLGFQNTGDADATFEIAVMLPVAFAPGSAFYGGSIGGALTGNADGGYLSSLDSETALYTALVDGTSIATLGDAPFELLSDPFGSADVAAEAFGNPIPGLEAAAAQEPMSIELNFILGSGDAFAVTSNYVARVPAPGAIALLAIAGGVRRRRRD